VVTHIGSGFVLKLTATPLLQGAGVPALSNFWGLLSAYSLCHRTTKFDTVTHTGRLVFTGSPTPRIKVSGPALPDFEVPFCLCMHCLSQNYRIWRGTHTGKGLVLGGQPRPHSNGAGPQRSPILRVPFYLCAGLSSHNYQIWRGNTCWRVGVCLGSATTLITRERSSSVP